MTYGSTKELSDRLQEVSFGKSYAQHKEDWRLCHWLKQIGRLENGGLAVEFGAGNGYKNSNIRLFERYGWRLVQWDAKPKGPVKQERVLPSNVCELFHKYKVPIDFDLLSIDVDGLDLWIWHALEPWHPRVVIVEYNSNFPHGASYTLPSDESYSGWDGSANFGASFAALSKIGERKGYWLVEEVAGTNLIFVRKDLLDSAPVVSVELPKPVHRGFDVRRFQVV